MLPSRSCNDAPCSLLQATRLERVAVRGKVSRAMLLPHLEHPVFNDRVLENVISGVLRYVVGAYTTCRGLHLRIARKHSQPEHGLGIVSVASTMTQSPSSPAPARSSTNNFLSDSS